MPQSWSSIRKKLEQDLLCENLKAEFSISGQITMEHRMSMEDLL